MSTHTQNSKFKTCWAIHYPDKKIKGFLPARQTQAQRRWVSLWSSLEQIPCVTKLPPLHHLCWHQAPDWLTATSADLQPASPVSLFFLYFSTMILLSILWGINNPRLYNSVFACNFTPFLFFFFYRLSHSFFLQLNYFLRHLSPSYWAGLYLSKTLNPWKTHSWMG